MMQIQKFLITSAFYLSLAGGGLAVAEDAELLRGTGQPEAAVSGALDNGEPELRSSGGEQAS